jgi:ketosteroid isomerase-like protein
VHDQKTPAGVTNNMSPSDSVSSDPQGDSFLRQLQSDMNDPSAGPALAAALEAIQDLAAEDHAAESRPENHTSAAPPRTHAMANCTFCGHPNDDVNKFCGLCGTPLPQGIRRSPAAPKLEPAASKPISLAAPPASPTAHPPSFAAPRENALGEHHYHHHYHHHFFNGEAQATPGAGFPASDRTRDLLPTRAPLTGPALSRGETTIRKMGQDYALACNTKQLEDLIDFYAADAIVMRSNHPPIRGSASIREFLVSQLDGGFGEVELEALRVEVIGDLAFDAGRCKMLVPSAMGKRREERGKYLFVYARQKDGNWKIAADCWASDLTLAVAVEPETVKTSPILPRPGITRKGA